MKNIVLLGGGGHALSAADTIEEEHQLRIAGFIDQDGNAPLARAGYKWLGDDSQIFELAKDIGFAHLGVGQIRTAEIRKRLYSLAEAAGFTFPNIVSSHASVSKSADLGEGSLVLRGAMINADVKLGRNVIINTGALVEHQAILGDFVHVAPGAIVLGNVRIGDGTFVGAGSVIREGTNLAAESFIKAGGTVTSDVF